MVVRVVDRALQRRGVARAGPAHIRNACAVIRGVSQARSDVGEVRAGVVADLDDHEPALRAITGVTCGVVHSQRCNAGNVRPVVPGVRRGVGGLIQHIPARGDLPVEVGEPAWLDARVEDRNHRRRRTPRDVPRLRRVRDVPAPRAPAQVPRARVEEVRVVRQHLLRPQDGVPLRVRDAWIGPQACQRTRHAV